MIKAEYLDELLVKLDAWKYWKEKGLILVNKDKKSYKVVP